MRFDRSPVILFAFVSLHVVVLLAAVWRYAPASHLADGESGAVFLPIIANGSDAIIPETTVVLTEDSNQHLVEFLTDGSRLVFAQSTPELEQVDEGDIIVSSVSANAPAGYLRRVTTVESQNGQLILTTSEAPLEQAIHRGSVSYHGALELADVQEMALAPGVSLQRSEGPLAGDGGFSLAIDGLLLEGVRVDGLISLQPQIDLDIEIEDFRLQEFRLVQHATETATLQVTADTEQPAFEAEMTIAHLRMRPIILVIGGVPVVVVPELPVVVGLSGNASAQLRTGVTQVATIQVGVEYVNGEWERVNSVANDYTPYEPSATGAMELRAYIEAELEVDFYAPLVNPSIELEAVAGLRFRAEANRCWVLSGFFESQIELEIRVLGWNIGEVGLVLIESDKVLLESDDCEPEGCQVASTFIDAYAHASMSYFADITDPPSSDILRTDESETGSSVPFSVDASVSQNSASADVSVRGDLSVSNGPAGAVVVEIITEGEYLLEGALYRQRNFRQESIDLYSLHNVYVTVTASITSTFTVTHTWETFDGQSGHYNWNGTITPQSPYRIIVGDVVDEDRIAGWPSGSWTEISGQGQTHNDYRLECQPAFAESSGVGSKAVRRFTGLASQRTARR